MSLAYIGLGANIGDAPETLREAARRLADLAPVVARSSLYRTLAWGVTDQPAFVNAAVAIETALEPHALLAALKDLERELGRTPTFRWGPRAIDLDILAYDGIQLDEPDLTIPHARLAERAFALVPLAEIAAAFVPLRDALSKSDLASVERFGAFEREETPR